MHEVEFKLPHLTLRGLSGGNPDGPFLLALHGWLDNCHSFLPMQPYLDDFNWVFLDFPGHGHSDHRSAGAHYYFIDWVYDIAALIRQQGWQDIRLLGHSMGGYVAQVLAAVYPEPIRAVALIEAFGLLFGEAEKTRAQLREGLDSRFKQARRRLPVYPDLDHLTAARARAGEFSDDLARLLLERNLKPVAGGYGWRTDPAVRSASPFRFTQEQVRNLLQGFRLPLHIVLGSSGHKDLHKAIQLWGSEVPDHQVTQVEGGHHVHMQSPAEVAQVIRDHLHNG